MIINSNIYNIFNKIFGENKMNHFKLIIIIIIIMGNTFFNNNNNKEINLYKFFLVVII
jgi:hypothetical protein